MGANPANDIATKFTDASNNHNLQPAIDELNHDKSTMSAKQYASLLKGVNQELKTNLPGVTLTDSNATGAVALQAQDNFGVSMPVTGDAAGATNLSKVAADAQMPNAETFVASRMDGATVAATNGDETSYNTKDGGTAVVANVDSSTHYTFFGPSGDAQASISHDANDPHGSFVNFGSHGGYDSHEATATTKQYDIMYGKNMDSPTAMLVKDPNTGEVTQQKVSHVKQDLEVAGIAAGVIGIQGAAEASQVKIDQSKANIGEKLVGTEMVDDAGANLILDLAHKAPGAVQKPAAPLKDVPPQGQS
jgi:hypothetical protein